MEASTPAAAPAVPQKTQALPQVVNPAAAGMSKADKIAALTKITQEGATTGPETAPTKPEAPKTEPTPPADPLQALLDEELGKPGDDATEFTDVLVHEGVSKPVMEALQDAKFEVPYKGETRQVNGIQKLYELAAMGMSSSERNMKAKQAIQEAQAVIDSVKTEQGGLVSAGVKRAIEARFKDGMDNVRSGFFPNGAKIPDLQTQQRAVADLQALQAWVLGEDPAPQSKGSTLSADEIKAQVEANLKKEFEEQRRKERAEETNERLAQETAGMLGEVIKPLAQKFLKSDGKTLNTRQYQAYVREVQLTATNYAERIAHKYPEGFPANIRKAILSRAAQDVLKDFVTEAPKTPAPTEPSLRGGSGVVPTTPGNQKPDKKQGGPQPAKFTPAWFRSQREKVK